MSNKITRDLFDKDYKELRTQCNNLTKEMEAYMSNELDYQTIQTLKEASLNSLFEVQKKITEIDSIYGLIDVDAPQVNKDHANLVELLLGTLEQLETIFNK